MTKSEVVVSANNLFSLKFGLIYSVNGTSYTSDKFDFYDKSRTRWKGGKFDFVNKYPVGSILDIYYDSNDPHLTTVEAGFKISYLIWVIPPLFFFFLALQ